MFFRAFYAIPQTMRGPGGHMVNAVRGTLDTLARYVTDRRPRHLAFTTDEDWRPDWRVAVRPAYKEDPPPHPHPPPPPPPAPTIPPPPQAVRPHRGGLAEHEAEDN